jgi:hypothetical protein
MSANNRLQYALFCILEVRAHVRIESKLFLTFKKVFMAFYFDKITLNWVRKQREGGRSTRGKKGTEKNQSGYLPLQTVRRVGLEKQHFKSDKVLWEP